jgi:hypothetical protein
MRDPLNHPIVMFVGSVAVFWLGARIGAIFDSRYGDLGESTLEDFKLVLGATLTPLAL